MSDPSCHSIEMQEGIFRKLWLLIVWVNRLYFYHQKVDPEIMIGYCVHFNGVMKTKLIKFYAN